MICEEKDFSKWADYYDIEGFENLYLEDSFVLDITKSEKNICFSMEFVLTKEHHRYIPPKQNERYCYLRGYISFNNIFQINKFNRKKFVSFDATGESDLGNIDTFKNIDSRYLLLGSWGELDIESSMPTVLYEK